MDIGKIPKQALSFTLVSFGSQNNQYIWLHNGYYTGLDLSLVS